MKTVLQVQNMEKYYGNKGNVTKAVDGISFDVERVNTSVLWERPEAEKLRCLTVFPRLTV